MLMHSQISLFFMMNLNDTYPKIEEHQPVNGLTVPSHRQLVLASKVDISLWIPCGAWLGVVLQPLAGSPWGSCESQAVPSGCLKPLVKQIFRRMILGRVKIILNHWCDWCRVITDHKSLRIFLNHVNHELISEEVYVCIYICTYIDTAIN